MMACQFKEEQKKEINTKEFDLNNTTNTKIITTGVITIKKEWHWKRKYPQLKKDKETTLELGRALVAFEDLNCGNVLFFLI